MKRKKRKETNGKSSVTGEGGEEGEGEKTKKIGTRLGPTMTACEKQKVKRNKEKKKQISV